MNYNPMLQQNQANINNAISNNPMIQQMGRINNALNTINNPMLALQNTITQNPYYKEAMNFINSNGGNPEKAFYELARQKGIDPKTFLEQLNKSMNA